MGLLGAAVVAGCQTGSSPSSPASPSIDPSAPPSATAGEARAGLYISTDPGVLPDPLSLAYHGRATDLSELVDEVSAGTEVSISHLLAPDSVQILVHGNACGEPVDLQPDIELDVQIWWDLAGACRVSPNMTHALGKVSHPQKGALVGAVVPQGAIVVFQPLDPASTSSRVEVVAGPTGVEAMEMPPETYEVTATLRGELLIRTEVDLVKTPDIVLDLMALPPSTPRACNALDPRTCEEVIRAAMSYGQWIRPQDVVRSAEILDSDVMSCDVGLEAPFVDVRFELAPDGDIDVTVGHRGSGVYVACPPY